jgi:glycosyltransferase involved in cell wall biosynthesis
LGDRVRVVHAGTPHLPLVPAPLGPRLRIGFFGRLMADKGLDILTQAARLTPGVDVLVYGAGPWQPDQPPANLTLCGAIPDVERAMQGCDAVAIPSLWAEAFPFSGLEAMACGRAVVASQTGGLPEQVIDRKTGLLVPPGDPSALAQAFARLDADRHLTRTMGEAGRDRQRAEFSVEAFGAKVEAIYASIAKPGRVPQ